MLVGRKEEGKPMELPEAEHPLSACAEDLIDAIHSKDPQAVAHALEAAFQICDSQPHEEGEHE